MTNFKKLQDNTDIQELIKTTFDADLPLAGSWGYSKEKSTIIKSIPERMTLPQLEHMVSTIRAHLEMNITQEEENRYSGININERARENSEENGAVFNKITYEITAMKEGIYTSFTKEYKENYGKSDFDLNAHFKKRQEVTLTREVIHYFEMSPTI